MNWDNGWEHNDVGSGWWLIMALMMLVFWGGIVWLIATSIRRGMQRPALPPSAASPQAGRPDPEEILHERFARGEIDSEEYHQRVDALRARRPPPS